MKRISLSVVVATLLTIISFIAGFFFGEILASLRYAEVMRQIYSEELKLIGYQAEISLLQNSNACNRQLVDAISKTKANIGRRLEELERVRGKQDEEVKSLKERYMLYVFLNYEAMRRFKNACNTNDTLILFFYSNKPEFLEASEKQGFVLTYLYNKYKPFFHVFAIDASINNPLIAGLLEKYKVSAFPTIIINEKIKLVGLQPASKIESLI